MNTIRPGVYRHYKGKFYLVLGEARHSENGEQMVVYQALYGEYGWWVRPLGMFLEWVQTPDGAVRRFEYVGEALPDAQ
ncbi:MAG: DUF1653 domain-containing protein [Saprospiraceae bacterium]|nr:DUF1653 domain-containing protein [Saprospiraceae bacterium]